MFRWENFTTANGLSDNHVFCVLVDGDRVWAGTVNGLGLYESGTWKIFYPDGKLAATGAMVKGSRSGTWTFHYDDAKSTVLAVNSSSASVPRKLSSRSQAC